MPASEEVEALIDKNSCESIDADYRKLNTDFVGADNRPAIERLDKIYYQKHMSAE